MPPLGYRWLGRRPYREALALQHQVRDEVLGGGAMVLIGCEHEPVFTLGRGADPSEVLRPGAVPVVATDRGGRVTYHGPGQAVLYPIVDLGRLDLGVRRFVRLLEEAAIRTLAAFDIQADRDPHNPGVWVGDAKIAAIGLHVTHGVTTHGMALNVDLDLEIYDRFIPCGLPFHRVSSVAALRDGPPPPVPELTRQLAERLASLLGAQLGAPHPGGPASERVSP